MTETLVTAATVLVPLFLLIPLLGKYIDIKHRAIQSARYETWEYTVWYGADSETPSGFEDGDEADILQRVKSSAQVQNESRRRFFSDTRATIEPNDITNTWDRDDRDLLWTDHHGDPLIANGNSGTPAVTQGSTPDYTFGLMNTLLDIIDGVFSALAWVMDLTNSGVGFTMINTNGKAESTVSISLTAPTGLIDFPNLRDTPGVDDATAVMNVEAVATAAVLTDGWNTGSLKHTINQTGGMVPTRILADLISAVPGLEPVLEVASIIAPEWRFCNPSLINHPLDFVEGNYAKWDSGTKDYVTYADQSHAPTHGNGSLWLGYMNPDAVHPDRLGDQSGTHDCPDGICNFDPEPTYSDCE